MKYDNNQDMSHDMMNAGDKIWYVSDNHQRFLGIVLELKNNIYTIAYYDSFWTITNTTYDKIFPRIRDEKLPHIFEIYDVVLVISNNTKTLGVVTGYELGQYVVLKYAGKIWRRVLLPSSSLEHHDVNYDKILFDNRKILLSNETWIKWELPSKWHQDYNIL